MRIGVYGSSTANFTVRATEVARQLGRLIAQRGHTLVTGACVGVPYEAVKGAREIGGESDGFSAYPDLESHRRGGDPTEGFTRFVFVPADYEHARDLRIARKYRNLSSVASCDACTFVSGQYGTLNEFTNAYDLLKPCGIVTETGGFADLLPMLTEKVQKQPRPPIVFSPDPGELMDLLEREAAAPRIIPPVLPPR